MIMIRIVIATRISIIIIIISLPTKTVISTIFAV